MANIHYKTTEKPAVQRAVLQAIDWIGVRQTSYSEIARQANCTQSDCRYAILDLLEKDMIIRHQTKGYAGATRGYRYAYELTEKGQKAMQEPEPEEPKSNIPAGLFK